jgi:hypothetical protein
MCWRRSSGGIGGGWNGLDPDVHWTTAVEEQLHGRDEVVAVLKGDPPPAPPAFHEVRDGLIVRWIDIPG